MGKVLLQPRLWTTVPVHFPWDAFFVVGEGKGYLLFTPIARRCSPASERRPWALTGGALIRLARLHTPGGVGVSANVWIQAVAFFRG